MGRVSDTPLTAVSPNESSPTSETFGRSAHWVDGCLIQNEMLCMVVTIGQLIWQLHAELAIAIQLLCIKSLLVLLFYGVKQKAKHVHEYVQSRAVMKVLTAKVLVSPSLPLLATQVLRFKHKTCVAIACQEAGDVVLRGESWACCNRK